MTETPAQEPRCPYLEITEGEVRCLATYWGKTEEKQHFGAIPRNQIMQCSSPQHSTCPTFKKMRHSETWEKKPT